MDPNRSTTGRLAIPQSRRQAAPPHLARENLNLGRTDFWRRHMQNGWTPKRRARQARLIRLWRPWERSTGPKTPEGRSKVARNADKGGTRRLLRELSRLLRNQPA